MGNVLQAGFFVFILEQDLSCVLLNGLLKIENLGLRKGSGLDEHKDAMLKQFAALVGHLGLGRAGQGRAGANANMLSFVLLTT